MLLRLKIKWLQSHFRTNILAFRYVTLKRFFGKKIHAEIYLSLNDPHSFMLVQMLSRFAKNYRIDFKVLFIWGALPGVTISPKLYRQWAIKDANLIAEKYKLITITEAPSLKVLTTGQQSWQFLVNNIANAEQVFIKTWGNQFSEHYQTSTPTINYQVRNQERLRSKGHYAAASILLAGDWFVGVDRLYHFEQALLKLSFLDSKNALFRLSKDEKNDVVADKYFSAQDVSHEDLNKITNKGEPLVSYLSLRSPYSYLGFVQAISLAKRYDVELIVKPVLPLLMRGVLMPKAKQKYIYLDAVREAKRLDIELTGFVDPLGDGIINVYRFFSWAETQGKAVEYMLACFRAVYVDGIDLSKIKNVKIIFESLALDIDEAYSYQQKHDWQQWADVNQINLSELNFWGVPCFSYGDFSFWGQDRIPAIEKEIKSFKSNS